MRTSTAGLVTASAGGRLVCRSADPWVDRRWARGSMTSGICLLRLSIECKVSSDAQATCLLLLRTAALCIGICRWLVLVLCACVVGMLVCAHMRVVLRMSCWCARGVCVCTCAWCVCAAGGVRVHVWAVCVHALCVRACACACSRECRMCVLVQMCPS